MAIAQQDMRHISAKPLVNPIGKDPAKSDGEPVLPTIEGRVDAIDRQRLFGWVLVTVENITVFAITPETGDQIELRIPSQSEQHAQSAITAPLGKIQDRLDRLLAAQHILQNGQREAAKRLVDASKRMDELASADDGIEAGVKLVRTGQDELTRRVEELVLVRFDKSLGGFDERLSVLTERHRNDLKTPLLALSFLIGVAAGISVGAMVW